MLKIGDKVRVIKNVWDDGNEFDWKYSIGFIISESIDPFSEDIGWYVEFPSYKGKINTYDFYEDELEKIN